MVSQVGLAVLAPVDLIAIKIRVVREPHRDRVSFSADRAGSSLIRLLACLLCFARLGSARRVIVSGGWALDVDQQSRLDSVLESVEGVSRYTSERR